MSRIGGDRALIKQLNNTLTNLSKNKKGMLKAYNKAIYAEAEEIMTASQEEVPVDTGALKNSKFVRVYNKAHGDIAIFMGYDLEYAVEVHYTDKNYKDGKKWHYLTDPMREAKSGFAARIAHRMAWFAT